MSSGVLADHDLTTNEGDRFELEEQLRALRPELEQRTPHLVTWQHFIWPAHCGEQVTREDSC